MSSLKPYWKKHKWQRRVCVLFTVVFSPIVFPISYLQMNYKDIWVDCMQTYRELWETFKED